MRKNFLLLLLTLLPLAGWAAAPTAKQGLWAGTSQALVNAGTDAGTGKNYYYAAVEKGSAKPAEGVATTDIPTASAAGDYDVYWCISDGAHPKKAEWDAASKLTVSLNELSVSPTFAQYDAENHEFPTVSFGSTAIYNGMNDGNGGTWTVAWTKGSDAVTFYENVGTYTVTATNSTGNGTATFEVTKGTNWFTDDAVTISDWTYGDAASTPTGGVAKWGTVEYEYWNGSAWSATAPTAAGTSYQVRAIVPADADGNYDKIEGTPTPFNIDRRDIVENTDWTGFEPITGQTYSGSGVQNYLHTMLAWTDASCGTVMYKWINNATSYDAGWVTTQRWRDDAGSYHVQLQITPDPNHTVNGLTTAQVVKEFDVTIAQATLTKAGNGGVKTDLIYDGTDQILVASAPTFTGVGGVTVPGTVTYAWNDGENDLTADVIDDVLAKNAGEYAITYTFTPATTGIGPNYLPITEAQELGGTDAVAIIDKKEVIVAGNEHAGTIEELYNKTTEGEIDPTSPKFAAADFLKDVTILTVDEANKPNILNGIVTMTVPAFDDLQVGDNSVTFEAVADDENTTNYKANVLGATGNLKIKALAATIAAGDEPTVATTLVYTGQPQALLASAGVANGGTVVYSLDETAAIDTWAEAYNDDAIKGTLATSYSVFYTVKPDKFYEYTAAPDELTTSIAKKQLSDAVFELAEDEATYDGTSKAGLIALDYDNTTEPLDDEYALQIPDPITAATDYTITIVPKDADGNYQGSTTRTFTINAATDNEITGLTIAGKDNWTYGDEATAHAASASATYGTPTITYYFADGDALGAEVGGVPTEAGDYFVVASVIATGDYNGAESDPLAFTIAKANPAEGDITAAKAEVLTYDNTDQVLIQAATSAIGSFKYFVGETAPDDADSKDWSDKIATITGKDAATYKVWTLFVPDNNHNAPETNPTSINVTIQKAVIQYRLANAEKDWDGQPFADDEITAAYTPEIGGLLGDDITADPAPFTLSVPDQTITDAGTYTFTKLTVTPAEPTNYDVRFSGTAQLTINKADIVAEDFKAPTAKNPKFNGMAQDLVNKGEMNKDHEFGTFYYALQEDENAPVWNDNDATHAGWTLAVPQATNANHYPVWYAIAGDNNHNSYVVPAAIDATIKAADLAVTMLPAKYQKTVESTYTAYDQTPKDITLTGLTAGTDYKIDNPYVDGIVDVDNYALTVVGLNNYAGSSLTVNISITQAPLMITAPSATKTYDGTNEVEEDEFEDPIFNGLLGGDKIDLGNANDYVTIPANAINNGTYDITMEIDAIPAQQNYEVKAVLPGTLTINKVKSAKIGFQKDFKYTKVYGAADPEYTFAAANLTQEGIVEDLSAIVSQLTASRTQTGEEVTEEGKGYTVQLAAIDRSKLKKDEYLFADNYETIEYGTTVLAITPAELTVSIASVSRTYNGEDAALAWAEDLSNMIVAGLPKDKDGNEYPKTGIFTTPPTIEIVAIDGSIANANEYNILLKPGVSPNYDVTLIQGSYYTIEPVAVEAVFNNTYTTEVGAVVADVLASVDWTVVAADEDQIEAGAEETVAAALALTGEKKLFDVTYVGASTGTEDKKAIAEGEDGEDALKVVYLGQENPANFVIVPATAFGDLNIGAAGSVLALDDSEEIVTTAGKATVTFSQSRNVKQDVWQAAVLPFKTTPAEISDAFGYAAVDVLDKSRTNDKEVHFCLMVTGDIEAGTPFLFKTDNNNNFNNVTFENVDVVATENLNTTVEDDDAESPSGIKFIGTFEAVDIWGVNYRYLSGGTWYNAKNFSKENPATIKPLRAYLDMNGNTSARIFIDEPDGTTSIMDINSFNNMMNAEGWYTIEGKKLNAAPTQKGIYIQNGKKVVIK